jgi:hypothetical protein
MKKIILFFVIAFVFAACKNNQAKVESAATDSATINSNVVTQPAAVKKEVHYVNTENTSQPAAKKGWSNAAKGAAIGGAAGAVTGAVVDKNHRVQGAVIGAAVGAGAGYLIGKHKDKKKKRAS